MAEQHISHVEARKPRGRAKQVAWLEQKLGPFISPGLAALSDRQFHHEFARWWDRLREAPDYTPVLNDMPHCIRCGRQVKMRWECGCTDHSDLPLTERDDNPEEWDRIIACRTQPERRKEEPPCR